MTDQQITSAIKAVVKGHFDSAAADFSASPTGGNWSQLLDAMWARKAITSDETMRHAVASLPQLGVGHWITHLRKLHEGKSL